MANLTVNTLDEDLITCQICLYEFDEENKQPKFLQCSHTICLECFQAARRQDMISCPFCRRCTSNDGSNGAEWILPTNQYALELLRLNRSRSNSMPSTAVPVREPAVEEESDEQLSLAMAMSAREIEEEYTLIEAMHQSLLDQQQEQVITTAAATADVQPADEDEQLRLALEMSVREMEREALNVAIRPRRLPRQQRVWRNAVAAAPDAATSDDPSNEDIFIALLLFSSVLCYAFLLFWQLIPFFWHRLHFAFAIVFLLVNSAINSFRVNLYMIFFCLVLSCDIFFLFLELFMFFFYHLELLLVIVFLFFVCAILIGSVSDQTLNHRTVPLSSTF